MSDIPGLLRPLLPFRMMHIRVESRNAAAKRSKRRHPLEESARGVDP